MINIDIIEADKQLSGAIDILRSVPKKMRYDAICKISNDQMMHYKELLDKFKFLNEQPNQTKNLHILKGKSLEELVSYLLEISGKIFIVDRNIRTSTNEIDQIVSLNETGKVLLANKLINYRFEEFLGECKNYNKVVDVTYIGKFCSLLLTNKVKLGIMFSYHGVSGSNWNYGSGLIKKFYLHKEDKKERYCIIDFSIKQFESILNGENLLQIMEDQIKSLQYDTDYKCYLSPHPAESVKNIKN